jgi:hypothetical protein
MARHSFGVRVKILLLQQAHLLRSVPRRLAGLAVGPLIGLGAGYFEWRDEELIPEIRRRRTQLSMRESDVVDLAGAGYGAKDIAPRLDPPSTVKTVESQLYTARRALGLAELDARSRSLTPMQKKHLINHYRTVYFLHRLRLVAPPKNVVEDLKTSAFFIPSLRSHVFVPGLLVSALAQDPLLYALGAVLLVMPLLTLHVPDENVPASITPKREALRRRALEIFAHSAGLRRFFNFKEYECVNRALARTVQKWSSTTDIEVQKALQAVEERAARWNSENVQLNDLPRDGRVIVNWTVLHKPALSPVTPGTWNKFVKAATDPGTGELRERFKEAVLEEFEHSTLVFPKQGLEDVERLLQAGKKNKRGDDGSTRRSFIAGLVSAGAATALKSQAQPAGKISIGEFAEHHRLVEAALLLAGRYIPGFREIRSNPLIEIRILRDENIMATAENIAKRSPHIPQLAAGVAERQKLERQGLLTDSFTFSVGTRAKMAYFTLVQKDAYQSYAELIAILFHEIAHIVVIQKHIEETGGTPLSTPEQEVLAGELATASMRRMLNDPDLQRQNLQFFQDMAGADGVLAAEEKELERWRNSLPSFLSWWRNDLWLPIAGLSAAAGAFWYFVMRKGGPRGPDGGGSAAVSQKGPRRPVLSPPKKPTKKTAKRQRLFGRSA